MNSDTERREALVVVRSAFAKALATGPDVSPADAAILLANMLGDALAQAFGEEACEPRTDDAPSPLEEAFNIAHAALHISLKNEGEPMHDVRPAGVPLH